MLYEIAHIIRDKFGFIWEVFESVNSCLFACRYRRRLKGLNELLATLSSEYTVRQTTEADVKPLVHFFKEQPEASFDFFRPHKFDEKSMRKIIKSKAFQTFVVVDDDHIMGYFFLRSFFSGKCFRGRMVDYNSRGKGIGTLMAKAIEQVAAHEGIRMFASISPDNLASLESAKSVSEVKIIKTLSNGYYFIEVTPRQKA